MLRHSLQTQFLVQASGFKVLPLSVPERNTRNAMNRGVAKMEAFTQRLGQAAGRLQLLGTLLQHKEASTWALRYDCIEGALEEYMLTATARVRDAPLLNGWFCTGIRFLETRQPEVPFLEL